MKHFKSSVVALLLLAAAGCSMSYRNETYDIGFDFPSENVSKIVDGKTTADDLIHLFGGPYAKHGDSENEEVWRYYYATSHSYKENDILANEITSFHQNKTLLIRLKNGVVIHHSYSVGR
jgi:outer membrane protein assembly factor BamE (lipoprotein component of BamABCDE complex)